MSILASYDDGEIARAFGTITFERGRQYVEDGHVLEVSSMEPRGRLLALHGRVAGSRAAAYAVHVTMVAEHDTWIDSRCTCPVVRMCKHGAAVVIAARDAEQGAWGVDRDWERRLSLVLDELDTAAEVTAQVKRSMALQLELTPARQVRRFGPAAEDDPGAARGSLRVRPLQRGAKDNWVKSGASFNDLHGLAARGEHVPDQVAALEELLSAHRAANRHLFYGADGHLTLSTFGANLWSVLRLLRDAGVEIVPAGALRQVQVSEQPVALTLDVNGADTSRAHLRLGVRHGEEWYAGDRLEVLGAAGHGVALWTPTDDRWDVVLAPLATPAGPHTRRLLAAAETLPVPVAEVDDLVSEYLPRLQRHVPVVSSDGSVRVPEVAEPRLVLTVTWKAVDEVHVVWTWRYRIGGEDGADRVYGVAETRGLRGIRRPDEEARVVAGLELSDDQVLRLFARHRREHGLVPVQTFTGMTAVAFVEETLVPLEESEQVEIEEVGARPDFREVTEAPVIRFAPRAEGEADAEGAVEQRTDWLDLEVIITVGDRAIGLATLLEALTLGQERLILRDGRHLRLDRPEFAALAALVGEARELQEQPRDGVRIGHHDLGLWDELAEIGLVDEQAARWVQAARALRELDELPAVEPVGVQATLRGYQLGGLRWLAYLHDAGLGGILADDMGLGKTLQTLALIAHARAGGAAPFLVVAPTSVVATWVAEAATFTPGLVVRGVTESRARRGTSLAEVQSGADVVVTSYTLYRLEVEDHLTLEWGGLVLDEAHMIKNHTGKTHQSVRRLDVPFRLALTGTPMENRLMELWSLLSVVAPGLYPWPQRFAETVANPVERDGDQEALARFLRRIRPFLLRRTKELVAGDLPPKQEQVLEVQLTPRHRRVYDLHLQRERQQVLGLLEDFDKQRVAIFRSLTRLRQLSLDPALVDDEYDAVGSAKIDVLVDHLQEVLAEGHRALVFSQFTSFLTRVRRRLDAEGITSKYLDGRTRRRGEVVSQFKEGEGAVFLISLKAGGTGLTLTEADYVFVLDPWWNPAVEAQAVDRAHRIGQTRPVIVYRLVATDTIEEKVMALKARKAALFAKVVDGGSGGGAPLAADDIKALFED